MKPGKKLDVLVAEKIFNDPWPLDILYLHDENSYLHDFYVDRDLFRKDFWLCINYTSPGGAPFLNRNLPKYSSYPAQAWKVVEKMDTLLWACIIELGPTDIPIATFWTGDTFHTCEGETPAHAICLAALKAIEDETG